MGSPLFLLLTPVLALLLQAPSAGGLRVTPIHVFLSPKNPSMIITLRSERPEPVRFQVSVYAWERSLKDEMQLGATEDIVFFPRLLTVPPSGERKIRVGCSKCGTATEKSYRLFVEELPPPQTSQQEETESGLRMLLKMGIPVFIQPAKSKATGSIETLTVHKRNLSFQVRNSGNVHIQAQKVQVKALGPTGETVFERQLGGSYVLAGATRLFELELPEGDCARIKALHIEVKGDRAFARQFQIPGGACGE